MPSEAEIAVVSQKVKDVKERLEEHAEREQDTLREIKGAVNTLARDVRASYKGLAEQIGAVKTDQAVMRTQYKTDAQWVAGTVAIIVSAIWGGLSWLLGR